MRTLKVLQYCIFLLFSCSCELQLVFNDQYCCCLSHALNIIIVLFIVVVRLMAAVVCCFVLCICTRSYQHSPCVILCFSTREIVLSHAMQMQACVLLMVNLCPLT